MTSTAETSHTTPVVPDPNEWTGSYRVQTAAGRGRHDHDVEWNVLVFPKSPDLIARRVEVNGKEWPSIFKDAQSSKYWSPEPVIWPTWPPGPDGLAPAGSPLKDVHEYWSGAGQRLRDSAKWMSAVIGAALAAVAGTSPLADMRRHAPAVPAIGAGAAGFVLLAITLFLVLQVMRPVSVSYTDVQSADASDRNPFRRWNPLKAWKKTVEAQQDLYLPFGIKCLTSLRQAAIIEEVTLAALACAVDDATNKGSATDRLRQAQRARATRLQELRDAANRIAIIGEYYRLKRRSARATYAGVPLGVLGTAAMLIAFGWPHT